MTKGLWGFLWILLGTWLSAAAEVVVLPASGVAGRTEPYRILVTNTSFSTAGRAVFDFPEGFSPASIRSVKAFARDAAPEDFSCTAFKIRGRRVEIDYKSRLAAGGQTVLFELKEVRNPERAGNFEVQFFAASAGVDSTKGVTARFSIIADKPAKLAVPLVVDSVVRAGGLVLLSAAAQDRFGNPVPDVPVFWRIASGPEGDGNVVGNRFFATRAGAVELKASSPELSGAVLKLDVAAGALDSFEVAGVPESTVAGVPFPGSSQDSIIVTAKDQFGNPVTNFSGTVSFSSDDPLAVLPAPYTFTAGPGGDNGRHAFPGSQFVLKKGGWRHILASSGGQSGSSRAIFVNANYLADFFFFAPPDVIAGKSFDAAVAGGVDLYGNPASGTVQVIPILGGGASPSGAVPAFSSITVVDGTGKSQQTLVSTSPTVLRGSNGYFSAFTDTTFVRPAALGGFSLSLLPDTLHAGDSVSTFIAASKDRFGNLKTDFGGSGYFSSSDSRAILQYPAGHPYSFSTSDSGRHAFAGSSVKFFSKGTQSLSFGDDSLRSPAMSFLILPGPAVSFAVSAPTSVVAGAPFPVSVQNAKDGYDNPVSLSVQIGLKTGSGVAPSGDVPVLPAISVTDGSGQGQAVLPKAEKAVLEGISGALRFVTDTILVLPGGLEKFEWNLVSPQISGAPFSPPATLSAKDRFGNLKTNFDASGDSVVLSAQPTGGWEKGILKNSSDFVSGTADLAALGVVFFGPAGSYLFNAASASGKSGSSGAIEVRSIFVDSFSLNPASVIRGQSTDIAFRVTNQSPGPFVLDGVKLLAAGRELFLPLPALPDTLTASGRNAYSAAAAIPGDFPMGKFPVQLELSGRFGDSFSAIRTGVLDSLAVADSLFLRPAAGGLNFEQVSKSRLYGFSAKMINQSNFDVVLDSATRLVFGRSGISRSFAISTTTLLARLSEGGVAFRADSFPTGLPSGGYAASLVVFGRRDGVALADSFSLGDSIVLEDPSRLYYAAGSIAPRSVLLDVPLNIRLRLGNSGQAAFHADTLSQLVLVHGNDSLRGYLQPAASIVAGPPVELDFWITRLLGAPPKGIFNWRASVKLSGAENGLAVDTLLSLPDSVALVPPPGLVLDSVWAQTPSPNRVNSDRSFPVRVRLFNPSPETLSATWLYVKDGNAQLASLLVGFLAPQEFLEKSLTVPADSSRLGPVNYRIEVLPGYGTVSSAPAELTVKMDQISVLRQRKAVLDFSPAIVSPPSATSGMLAAGQALTLSIQLRNFGEAPVGAGRIRLKAVPPLLTFLSDSSAAVSAAQPAVFQLLAKEVVDSGRLVASWAPAPDDSNTAAPADVAADSVSVPFKILPARAALLGEAREQARALLYAGEPSTPLELAFTNSDASGSHLFLLKKISIGISGLNLAGGNSGFESATLSDGVQTASAAMEQGRLAFTFSPPVRIETGGNRRFSLTVKPEAAGQSFRFYTRADLVEAVDSASGGAAPALLVKPNGEPFAYTTSVFTTAAGVGLAASLVSYPNPFSPPAEKIQIAYRLSAASEVEMKIYTLTGERVFEKTFASGAGINQIEWDGTNGRGETVKNGVYIAVLRSKTTGETTRQKLAVVK